MLKPSRHLCTVGFLVHTVVLLSTGLTGAGGLQVVSTGPQTVLKAEGDSVVLGCKYRSSLRVDSGDLDVEWSALSPDSTHKDQMLLSFSGGITYTHDQVLGKGLSFTVTDPSQGDASLSIAALTPAHSATYQCKVKKAPGVDTRKVTLMVLVKPSEPQCWLEGDPWVGRAAALQCHSNTGSSPLKYSWRREGGVQLPVTAKQNSVSGELKITNLTLSSAGFYFCEVNNAVGAERCRINLRAMTPPNSSAVIVGIVVGSLLLIFILLVFISLIYWKLSSRWHHEKEFSNDIREDVAPPQSRPVSRHTSRCNSQHHQGFYSPVVRAETDIKTQPSSWDNSNGNNTPVKMTAVEYNKAYGYAV